ncbi:Swt1 family HEPN domain-containing protein [Oxalobacteraceae bacterium OTU3REALA1]|nr:Swt1 family HEPN domain-containing protein [Oxalobacteraceae bacterium OTU3REALA1]
METIDVTQFLKDAENSLRDFIAIILQKNLGGNWVETCGISNERIDIWRERQQTEARRQSSGTVEPRLIYYADFYDLPTILKKHWNFFDQVFGKWRRFEVFWDELQRFRDPDAHRRELLPHQKYLIIGIAGEIRNSIVRYRSKMETSEDYYPRFETVRDSLGNVFVPHGEDRMLVTGLRLRAGDQIELVSTATDPLGEQLEYAVRKLGSSEFVWQNSGTFSVVFDEGDVRQKLDVQVAVRSLRKFHAFTGYDDLVGFRYELLPPVGRV